MDMQPGHYQQRRMVASSKAIKVGPWGGTAGSPWDDGAHRGVRSIALTYGRFLESMRVEYDRNGRPVHGEKHGGGGDGRTSRTAEVKLDYPYEFLTGVGGRCGPVAHGGSTVVRSLTFRTSTGAVHGPFGDASGDGVPFEYPMEGGVVVGFSGRSGWWHLDAVGLHVAALRPEMLCDVVQERGAMAYRSFVYGNGSSSSGAHQLQQKRKPFEWCYK
uniref:Jacalin-type lectin domain-containing protein n=1 Tax=Oryza glumipatula TaxID=40148 RepID=A0A0D9YDV1_9ORYZ